MSDSVSKLLIERYGVMVFLVVIFVLAIIAILHFGIKFDINMYIASRKERHRKLAQSYCPHLDFIPRDDNSVQVSPLFYSPPGTLNWFCSRCGAVLPYEPNQEEVEAKATYYLNHPKADKKRQWTICRFRCPSTIMSALFRNIKLYSSAQELTKFRLSLNQ